MSDQKIRRRVRSFGVTLATSVASSEAIRFEDAAGGCVSIAAGVTHTGFSTTVQVWGSSAAGGQYSRLYTSDAVAADLTLVRDSVNSTIYAIPDACFGAAAIKLVTQSTHVTTATVIVKS
jgi:hypothetical protein